MHSPLGIAISLCMLGFAFADDLTLTDVQGRSIEVVMKSADDHEVVGIRKSDRKEVKLPLATLDATSRGAVTEWRKKVGRMPTHEQNFELKSSKLNELITISFKLPDGKYNADQTDKTRVKVIFDSGDITFIVWIGGKKPEEIAADLDRMIAGMAQRMAPSERAAFEPGMKPVPMSIGEYRGYEVPQVRPGMYMCKVSSKDCRFEAWLKYKEDSPIQPADIKAILATVRVGEKKKPLAERR